MTLLFKFKADSLKIHSGRSINYRFNWIFFQMALQLFQHHLLSKFHWFEMPILLCPTCFGVAFQSSYFFHFTVNLYTYLHHRVLINAVQQYLSISYKAWSHLRKVRKIPYFSFSECSWTSNFVTLSMNGVDSRFS